jgi:hypothetical protein
MLNRRDALKIAGGLLLGPQMAQAREPAKDFGWPSDPGLRRRWLRGQDRPYYSDFAGNISGTGRGKQMLLWPFLEKVTGKPYYPSIQDIGDCTAHAMAMAVNVLTAVQIAMHRRPERWVAPAATEPIYAGARVEIGNSKLRANSDGALVVWAGDWVQQYGILLRQKYGDIDLTKYNAHTAKQWGAPRVGVPDRLERVAKEHPVKTIKVVTNWSEARDLIYNGYPIVLGSNVGFNMETDRDGFLHWTCQWNHAMLLAGMDDKSKRPGGVILNSWPPDWVSGPKHKLGTPAGGFWADARTIDAMLEQEDSIAVSNYTGYRRQPLNYMLIP